MKKIFIAMTTLLFLGSAGFASESLSEKASSTGKDVKRSAKKAWNRTKEAVCMEGDLECAAKKAKNRAGEGADYVKDKAQDVKNSVDSNSSADN